MVMRSPKDVFDDLIRRPWYSSYSGSPVKFTAKFFFLCFGLYALTCAVIYKFGGFTDDSLFPEANKRAQALDYLERTLLYGLGVITSLSAILWMFYSARKWNPNTDQYYDFFEEEPLKKVIIDRKCVVNNPQAGEECERWLEAARAQLLFLMSKELSDHWATAAKFLLACYLQFDLSRPDKYIGFEREDFIALDEEGSPEIPLMMERPKAPLFEPERRESSWKPAEEEPTEIFDVNPEYVGHAYGAHELIAIRNAMESGELDHKIGTRRWRPPLESDNAKDTIVDAKPKFEQLYEKKAIPRLREEAMVLVPLLNQNELVAELLKTTAAQQKYRGTGETLATVLHIFLKNKKFMQEDIAKRTLFLTLMIAQIEEQERSLQWKINEVCESLPRAFIEMDVRDQTALIYMLIDGGMSNESLKIANDLVGFQSKYDPKWYRQPKEWFHFKHGSGIFFEAYIKNFPQDNTDLDDHLHVLINSNERFLSKALNNQPEFTATLIARQIQYAFKLHALHGMDAKAVYPSNILRAVQKLFWTLPSVKSREAIVRKLETVQNELPIGLLSFMFSGVYEDVRNSILQQEGFTVLYPFFHSKKYAVKFEAFVLLVYLLQDKEYGPDIRKLFYEYLSKHIDDFNLHRSLPILAKVLTPFSSEEYTGIGLDSNALTRARTIIAAELIEVIYKKNCSKDIKQQEMYNVYDQLFYQSAGFGLFDALFYIGLQFGHDKKLKEAALLYCIEYFLKQKYTNEEKRSGVQQRDFLHRLVMRFAIEASEHVQQEEVQRYLIAAQSMLALLIKKEKYRKKLFEKLKVNDIPIKTTAFVPIKINELSEKAIKRFICALIQAVMDCEESKLKKRYLNLFRLLKLCSFYLTDIRKLENGSVALQLQDAAQEMQLTTKPQEHVLNMACYFFGQDTKKFKEVTGWDIGYQLLEPLLLLQYDKAVEDSKYTGQMRATLARIVAHWTTVTEAKQLNCTQGYQIISLTLYHLFMDVGKVDMLSFPSNFRAFCEQAAKFQGNSGEQGIGNGIVLLATNLLNEHEDPNGALYDAQTHTSPIKQAIQQKVIARMMATLLVTYKHDFEQLSAVSFFRGHSDHSHTEKQIRIIIQAMQHNDRSPQHDYHNPTWQQWMQQAFNDIGYASMWDIYKNYIDRCDNKSEANEHSILLQV